MHNCIHRPRPTVMCAQKHSVIKTQLNALMFGILAHRFKRQLRVYLTPVILPPHLLRNAHTW